MHVAQLAGRAVDPTGKFAFLARQRDHGVDVRDVPVGGGSRVPTSLTIGRAAGMIEPPIDLARHDKIVLVQPLDLLGAQRDGRVAPAEADIGMVAFCLSQVAHVSNKLERFLKIVGVSTPLAQADLARRKAGDFTDSTSPRLRAAGPPRWDS